MNGKFRAIAASTHCPQSELYFDIRAVTAL